MIQYLYILAGGGIGAVLRVIFQQIMGKHNGIGFPFATFSVNVIGCLLIGLSAALALKFKWSEQTVLFICTGILGGFTTFSTFSFEFFNLMKNNQTVAALLYVVLSNIAGLSFCAIGYYLIKS